MKKYLRNKVDGFIYDWNPILAQHPKCEEVSEMEAYPERFLNKEQVDKSDKRRRGRKLDLGDMTVADPPEITNEMLNKDASRRGFAASGTAGLRAPQ